MSKTSEITDIDIGLMLMNVRAKVIRSLNKNNDDLNAHAISNKILSDSTKEGAIWIAALAVRYALEKERNERRHG